LKGDSADITDARADWPVMDAHIEKIYPKKKNSSTFPAFENNKNESPTTTLLFAH